MIFEIEKAEISDIPALSLLIESAYRGETAKIGWTSESDLIDGKRLNDGELAQVIGNSDNQIFIIRDSEDSSSILASICIFKKANVCEFGMFAVDPKRQSNGVGKALLSHAENFAKTQWGFARMQLSVITKRQSLIDYYKRRGYSAIGKTFSMSDHHLNDGMTRGHDLELEIYEKKL